jgi:hypothetical protein
MSKLGFIEIFDTSSEENDIDQHYEKNNNNDDNNSNKIIDNEGGDKYKSSYALFNTTESRSSIKRKAKKLKKKLKEEEESELNNTIDLSNNDDNEIICNNNYNSNIQNNNEDDNKDKPSNSMNSIYSYINSNREKRKRKSEIISPIIIDGDDDDDDNNNDNNNDDNKIKNNMNLNHTDKPNSLSSQSVVSKFLSTFLKSKRDSAIAPPPEDIPMSDEFLIDFFNNAPERINNSDSECESENNDDDVLNVSINSNRRNSTSSIIIDSDSEEEEEEIKEIKLFNLPYNLKPAYIIKRCKQLGVIFTDLIMDIDKKSGLPSGGATGVLASDCNLNVTIATLQNEDIGGRPLRVRAKNNQSLANQRRLSGNIEASRYYSDGIDITVKCHSCGEVGHKYADCKNPVLKTPCHLCAGTEHDSNHCLNINCFRCGEFGHHSKSCVNAKNYLKHIFCSQCGSRNHDKKHCDYNHINLHNDKKIDAKKCISENVEDSLIQCISCFGYGHAMCQKLPHISTSIIKKIFCPNCGMEGHHVEYPELVCGDNKGKIASTTYCSLPRYEAYIKFPNLLRDIDKSNDYHKNDNQYFRNLVKSAFSSDSSFSTFLFPSLLNSHNFNRRSLDGVSSSRSNLYEQNKNNKSNNNNFYDDNDDDYGNYKIEDDLDIIDNYNNSHNRGANRFIKRNDNFIPPHPINQFGNVTHNRRHTFTFSAPLPPLPPFSNKNKNNQFINNQNHPLLDKTVKSPKLSKSNPPPPVPPSRKVNKVSTTNNSNNNKKRNRTSY